MAPGTAHERALANVTVPEGDPGQDPVGAAIYHEELDHVLGALGPLDRRLVDLRLRGYSTAEAARELGLDPHHLRVRLGRLRQRLADAGVTAELL
jgi:RNA polymerase sigma-70 factor (ECF subfamily)